jgi:hypothetical protein
VGATALALALAVWRGDGERVSEMGRECPCVVLLTGKKILWDRASSSSSWGPSSKFDTSPSAQISKQFKSPNHLIRICSSVH